MATRMQQRRGTSAQWAAANPVLADGEIGFDKTTKVMKMGDGVSTWNVLPPILEGYFLPVGGKAYDSDRLDGLDSTAFAQKNYVDGLILPAGASRQLSVHFGIVTTFPSTGVRVGDRCYRSDLFCEFYYTGAAWRQTERATLTSAQRVAFSTATKADLYVGFQIYESDTLFDRRWDGTYWEIQQWRGARAGVTGSGATGLSGGPAMGLHWVNAPIAHNTNTDYTNWTNVYSPGTTYANAGDGPGGPALMTYLNTAAAAIRFNAKGRVQIDAYANSDGGVLGAGFMGILSNFSDSLMGAPNDRRHRGNGYAGSGILDQWASKVMYVNPGDTIGLRIFQFNSTSAAVTYGGTYLQAKYI